MYMYVHVHAHAIINLHVYAITSIYNCPCNVHVCHGSKVKWNERNHGNKVKLCPEFCKQRSWEMKRRVRELDDKNKNLKKRVRELWLLSSLV